MAAVFWERYNGSYTMAAKPIKSLELHYTMIQFLIQKHKLSAMAFGGVLLLVRVYMCHPADQRLDLYWTDTHFQARYASLETSENISGLKKTTLYA